MMCKHTDNTRKAKKRRTDDNIGRKRITESKQAPHTHRRTDRTGGERSLLE